jgi:prepilin-type N-terminal cleavage/methylation domain-containing protein
MISKLTKAFTLAEVLLTLTIVGVIASETIPVIINDTKEVEYNIRVKQAFANLSEALRMIQVNNAGSVNIGIMENTMGHYLLSNEFGNVMIFTKKSNALDVFGPINTYSFYKNSARHWPDAGCSTLPAVITNTGYLMYFYSFNNCIYHGVNACGWVGVDTNGKKGPNMTGKDLYFFWITRQNENGMYKIAPQGASGDTFATLPNGCTVGSTSSSTSHGCTAQRLLDPDHMP